MLLEGRYRYARELGRGGGGRVVLAHDVRDEAPRALKIVAPEARGTLELELDVLRRVAHPTLASVFELLRLSEPLGAPFRLPAGAAVLVEGFVDGTRSDVALGALASDDTRWRLAMRVARDVLVGLAQLHTVGLVHGDVSPANVLVRAEGQPLAVLVDLGLAGPPLGADGLARGTRGFLAPEAAVGARTQGTDLFGLGACLRSWLGTEVGRVPSALAALVDDLHATDPRDRPATAAEALEALSSIAATLGEPWEPADVPVAVVEPVYVGDAERVASAAETLESRGWLRVGGPRASGRSRFAREVAAALQARRRREGRRVPTFVRVDAPDDVATLEAASTVVHVEGGVEAFDVARRAEEVGGRERLWILEGAAPADVELEALDDASFARLAKGLGVVDVEDLRRRSARLAGRACRLVLGTPSNDDDAPSWAEERLDVAGGVLPSSVAGDVRALVREGLAFVEGDRVIARADRRGVADPAVHAARAAEVRRRLAARGHPRGPWDAYLARACGEADAAVRFAAFAAKALEEGRVGEALELAREAGPAHREIEARALARSARYGEALAAAAELPGSGGAALRAELARRQGDAVRAAREATAAGGEGADTLGWLALGRGELDVARSLARAPDLRAWVALSSGRPDEARAIVDEVLGRSEPRAAEGRETRARVSIVAGAIEQSRGELVRAAEHHASAFVSARAVGDVHLAATAAANEGIVALDAGRLAEGRRALRESARRYVRIGRARDLGRALLNLASVASWIGDDEGAEWHVHRARDACREAGDELGLGYVALVELELTLRRGALDALPPLLRALEGADARARCRAAAWLATSRPELARQWVAEGPPFERAYAQARLGLATNQLAETVEARVRLEPRTWEESWLTARLDLDLATARADERAVDEALRGLRALLDRTSRHLDADQRRALRRHPALTRAWAARPSSPVGGDDTARWRQLATLAATWVDRDATEILESGLELARDATDAERAFVVARGSDGALEARAARLSTEGEHDARPSRSVVARALASGALVTTVDALGDEEWGGAQSVHALALRSVACVPMPSLGMALYVDDRLRPAAFGRHDLAFLEVLASNLDGALAAAERREDARRARGRDAELRAELETRLARASEELEARRGGDRRFGLVARSAPMRRFVELLARVAETDSTVLLRGETGSGKERVARALHDASSRASGPFVAESCAALPEGLLESALFGHVRGAFSGATERRRGLFELADGGTLLLDEIGETSAAMQAKLLRAIQEGEVRPVGSERSIRVDVRIVAATHRDLREAVRQGSFREDLFYRVAVLELEVPPLRSRAEDLPELVAQLLARREVRVRVAPETFVWLASRSWPGNVRELDAALERALLATDSVLRPEHFGATAAPARELRDEVDALERRRVVEALEATGGNRTHAAARLGLSRVGLRKKMKRLGIE